MIYVPPLEATVKENGSLYMKIPCKIMDQIVERGKLSLVGKLQGVRLNIDLVQRWEKFKWRLRGNMDIISMLNDYMMFIFSYAEDRDFVLNAP